MRAWIVAIFLTGLGIAYAQPAPSSNPEITALDDALHKQEAARDNDAQEKTLRKLVAAQRKLSGDDSIYTWRRELALMSVLQHGHDQTASIALLTTMLAKAERLHGVESADVRDVLGWMIASYEIARTFSDEVDPLFQRMLAVSKKLHGDTGALYASDLGRYGEYLSARGEYVAAQRVQEQALKIEEAAKANVAGRLSTLGMLYMQTDVARAKATFDRYLGLQKAQPVEQQLHTIWWVSGFYRRAGRLDLATPLEKQAFDMARKEIARIETASGADAKELEPSLFTLGGMLMETGDLAGADPVLTRNIALAEKHGGFAPYAQLATLRRKQGRAKEALALYEKAQATMPGGTGLYSMMGDIYRELGDTKKAEELYLKAQADLDKMFGKRAMLVMRLHLGLFAVYVAAKKLDQAERVLTEDLDIGERELAFVLASGTETDHLAYFTREAYLLDTMIGFHAQVAPKRASVARLALTTLLRRKGRILDAAAASLGMLRARLPAEDKKLFVELEQARATLAKLAVQGAQGTPDFAKQVAALEDQIQKLEVTLARKSAELKIALQPVQLADVQHKVPKDARLVEIVNYQPGDVTAAFSATPKRDPRRYAAYVLADHGDPTVVDLGEAKPIDEAIVKLRAALADPHNAGATDLAKAMYTQTFAKLKGALGSAKHILLAPDGALNVVPFAALHDGKQFLVENYTFTYLTSGRDLLRLGIHAATTQKPSTVIFADPDFDGPKTAPAPGRRSRAMQDLTWPRLPGTAAEADALEKSVTNPTVYRGRRATETTLKGLHAPTILHLATHGFFLADADASVENPLLRSGLVFAGANALSSSNDDGIVTALEAAGLDLRGTQLVVMSACETGVGKLTNGEGVYGLRRAIVIAGAESLVMSMWQVDDAATKDLMVGYYKNLHAGMGRSEALRAMQQELHAMPKYAHPFYWASFIAAGNSEPLGK
jgi:CHAT domain-containing protein/Tfp pilus assembly protein PilF